MSKGKVASGLVESLYALAVASAVLKGASRMAYMARGYDAAGGEYCLAALAYWAAWMAMRGLVKALEGLRDERRRKESGS